MGDDLHLGPMSLDAALLAHEWRSRADVRSGLRSPFMLTEELQEEWYHKVVCDRRADSRWWAVSYGRGDTLAVVGLTGIQPENGLAEISLLVNPEHLLEGIGGESVHLVLAEAFDRMRLVTVFGECYLCNGDAVRFWEVQVAKHGSQERLFYIPRRKFWDGRLWDALLFCFTAEGWRATQPKGRP